MNFLTGKASASSPPVEKPPDPAQRLQEARLAWIIAAVLAAALVWSFWTTLAAMAERWSTDPQYSHGFLVPVFAAVVLWFRRDKLRQATWTPNLWGMPLLAGALSLRVTAVSMDIESIDAFSLLPALAGVVLLVGGVGVLAWCWPAIAFLAFMLPLPFMIETALAQPLRRLAT